ncbi:nicotinamide riboside transporter PnuC [Acidipropionibacterium jensenii]|uniref:nicotinamide riboside transporter PnuC n=1 Tax=Acidipropionibacterium jensenii TaxID=1749 RepID=UPI0026492A6D|nr:nicotinamide riboside transporter PnuC [Acidipropionibacterium jensenii]
MNWTEILGFVSGAVCVWLAVRQNFWNFPVGMANNVFFFILFIGSGLYADAWLQVLYLVLGGLGWYWWLRGGQDRSHLVVRRTPAWAWPASGLRWPEAPGRSGHCCRSTPTRPCRGETPPPPPCRWARR